MVQIVAKLEAGSPPPARGAPSSLQPVQDRELCVRLKATAAEKMKKEAVVTLESPVGSTWRILCDEGPYLGGDDEAPPPLVYFSVGIAF
jgi:hypothetical protein